MRIGVSSTGRTWVSMGPIGWLVFGWLYLTVLAVFACGWLLVQLLILAGRGAVWLYGRAAARR